MNMEALKSITVNNEYIVYITTNPNRTSLYIGVTNNLATRLSEHWFNRGNEKSWPGFYHCYNLIYYEPFKYIDKAIAREKQIKGWRREKKTNLIENTNPNWDFLNLKICGCWPPHKSEKNKRL